MEEDYVKTIRMMPSCLVSGQVAGTAAALALDAAKGDVGAVPYAGLRKRLDGRITFSPDEAACFQHNSLGALPD